MSPNSLMKAHQVESCICEFDWFFCAAQFSIRMSDIYSFLDGHPDLEMRKILFFPLQFSWNPNFPQELTVKSSAIYSAFFSLNISWSCWHFPKDWVDPAFLISERTPGWSCLRKSALSKWVLETRNIDYLISVRSQSASFPSLYSFPHPPTHPVLTLHQNAANTFAPSSNVGFWGTVGFKMHDATAESIISILYNEWKFNVQTWGFQPFH